MKIIASTALLGAFFIATPALAQMSAQPAPVAIAPMAAGVTETSVLRVGTPVPLKMSETITTKGKQLRVGYRVHLEVAEDIKLNGVTVIPAGSPAMGEITDVRNKGMWGKSGRINGRLLYVTVNGRQIRLSGQFDDKGVTGTAGVVAAVVFVPVVGFFTTGTSATIPIGGAVNGFIDEDVPLTMVAATPPAPLVVPTPAPTPIAATPAK